MQDGTQTPPRAETAARTIPPRPGNGGPPDGIERLRLPDGELWVNRNGGWGTAIREYALAGTPYREDFRPETLYENAPKGIRVTKLAIPGIGTCVLKEMSTAAVRGWRRRLEMAFRIAWRRKYRRTFAVAVATRAAGVDAYEPHAYWYRRSGGERRMFFLCEFVEGESFEALAREMRYPESDRESVLSGFRALGEMAARLNDRGIVNSDMLPQNAIFAEDGKGGRRLKLIDLDLACFAPQGGSRLAFVHRMRAFRRFVTYYPLNEECLGAFLSAYSRGDAGQLARCRKALEIFRRHAGRRILAGILVWLSCPPAGDSSGTKGKDV